MATTFFNGRGAGLRAFLILSATLSAATSVIAQDGSPPQEPLLRIEAGMHTAPIRQIGLSADGKLMASGSYDKTVRVWSLPDGRLIRTLRPPIGPGNEGKVFAVAMSADGRTVAAGGWDVASNGGNSNFVYLFDVTTGAIIKRLGPLPSVINALVFTADGSKVAASLHRSHGVQVWNIASGRLSGSENGYGDASYGIDFDAQGRLASTSYDGRVRLYDSNMGLLAKIVAPGGARPYGVSFSPDGKRLAVSYDDTTAVDVLDSRTLKKVFSADTKGLEGGGLSSVSWSADGQALFASGRHTSNDSDGVQRNPIMRWGDGGKGPRQTLSGPLDTTADLAPWGTRGVAFASSDPAIGVYDDKSASQLYRGPPTADMRVKLREHFLISPDARQVRFGLKYGSTNPWVFDVPALSFEASPKAPNDFIAPDTKSLAIADWEDLYEPTVEGKKLVLETMERSRSVAVLPDRSGFIMGAEYYLRRFDESGSQLWVQANPGVAWGVNISADGKIAVAAYGDGTIRWHRTSDGQELLALFVNIPAEPDEPKRWVLWTPKGYYTASVGGEDLIGWHVHGQSWDEAPDFFTASRFRDRFYRPDVVGLVLDELDEEKAVDKANSTAKRRRDDEDIRNTLPPVIEIISPIDGSTFAAPDMKISYSLRSPSGLPITGVEVRIDGRPQETSRSLGRADAAKFTEGRHEIAVRLPDRDVEVSLIARTEKGSSEAARARLTWGGAPEPAVADIPDYEKPKLYALVIGVSKYQLESIRLGYAAKDAIDFAAALQRQEGGLYSKVEVRLLADETATADSIREGFEWIEGEVTQHDVGIVFMAGHGVTDLKQRFYFLPVGADPQRLGSTAISKTEYADRLANPAGKIMLFIDACHSGNSAGLQQFASRGAGATDIDALVNDFKSADKGVVVFASSTGRQSSIEKAEWAQGAFTKAILEGLSGKADDNADGAINVKELDRFVSDRVKALTDKQQHPVGGLPPGMPDFPMAVVR